MSLPNTSSRRQFIKTAAAGVTILVAPSVKRAYGYQSANDRPVFATIGLRNQGWAITSKSFKFADFAALADVDAKVLAENVDKVEKKQNKNRMPIKTIVRSWLAKISMP